MLVKMEQPISRTRTSAASNKKPNPDYFETVRHLMRPNYFPTMSGGKNCPHPVAEINWMPARAATENRSHLTD